ncbi:MAG: NADH-quinone oxidoreductase subunit L [Euryhalocaulis sp.]|uniref:NADH-quinone oxidoreductase subunit L n=1 Tax=Euryhalocaulis sp. TaxID=2744307 RepID=UPI0017F315A7|nr:NADH-quinone oxidoreductase subunit L [Euryhalocaulis sp.]MBA4800399.1 NADH-quinone oxidoreductase subunit L [Euryhalocaulis sp.]
MYAIIVFGPLLGAAIAGLLQRYIGDRAAMWITTLLVCLSAGLSLYAFYDVAFAGNELTIEIARWFDIGAFQTSWSMRIDTLSAVMLVVVTFVSSLVHIYSFGYMSHDPHRARFFSYLSLFTFAMLMLVTANDFMQLFFGWEGVGLASYLLIGFWYKKPTANSAAIKAFVTNRVGDFGFALGIMAIFLIFGTIQFDGVFAQVAAMQGQATEFLGMRFYAVEIIAFLLFIGAMGKSAQFFLHVWLPDAMEGPTPVSALIHAATMVTAGVFLVVRCSPIFEAAPVASAIVAVIGAITAFFAATIGMAQNDIKRVVAYSTCSQLGYMFFAAGLGLYGAAMFHLFTHAFFKALLFLGSGSVIHALHDEQDMRKMGGMWKVIPWTYAVMLIGTLALTGVGIPGTKLGFAGFFSKDAIIEGAFAVAADTGSQVATLAFWAGVVAALLTSFYSWRLIFMTFHGKHRGPQEHFEKAHESPLVMMGPLLILAVGAVFAGALFYSPFVGDAKDGFWRESVTFASAASHGEEAEHGEDLHAEAGHSDEASETAENVTGQLTGDEADTEAAEAHAEGGEGAAHAASEEHGEEHGGHHVPVWVLWTPFVVTLLGFLGAVFFYLMRPGIPRRIGESGGPLHSFLYNKWFFDELYNATFVRGARGLGDLFWKVGDVRIVDGLGPNGVARAVRSGASRLSRLQTGYLYHYALVMLIAVVAIAGALIVLKG